MRYFVQSFSDEGVGNLDGSFSDEEDGKGIYRAVLARLGRIPEPENLIKYGSGDEMLI